MCCLIQLDSDLEEARGEVQQLKKLKSRSEQAVKNLEEEVSQLKSVKRRPTDAVGDEDLRKEVRKLVLYLTHTHTIAFITLLHNSHT